MYDVFKQRRFYIGTFILMFLIGGISYAVYPTLAQTGASLHNPGFDNHDWYEFNLRYQSSYPKNVWLPDDDNNDPDGSVPADIRQDWRLWFQNGKDLIDVDPEEGDAQYIHAGSSSVKMRLIDPTGWLVGGLYQPIYDTTPCLTYKFSMHVYARTKEADDQVNGLTVGIDRVGWHPDSKNNPAIHDYPSTLVWGTLKNQSGQFIELSAEAEAWADHIAVFTYANLVGGNSLKIYWDTGTLEDVTPASLVDPANLPAPAGIGNLSVQPARTAASVSWETPATAIGQVYYRLVADTSTPSNDPYKIYLPMVMGRSDVSWEFVTLNKIPTSAHQMTIPDLQPDSTYEYFVASKGVVGISCVTWVSEKQTFQTTP
jgi:hypothetical protein